MAYFRDDRNYWEAPKQPLNVQQLMQQFGGIPNAPAQNAYSQLPYNGPMPPSDGSMPNNSFTQLPYNGPMTSLGGMSPTAYEQLSGVKPRHAGQISGIETGGYTPRPKPALENNNLFSLLGGLVNNALQSGDEQAAAEDPMAIYEQIRNATPGYSYKGPSVKQMVASEFDPMVKLLASQRAGETTRYQGQKTHAADSYGAFVKQLQGSQATDQKAYKDAGTAIANEGKAASNQITSNTKSSNADMAALLKDLGQEASAPTLLSNNQKDLTNALGLVAADQTNAATTQTGLGAARKAYDEDSINSGRQAGMQYQGDLLDAYNAALANNDQQSLDLLGQRGAATNKYTMDLQSLLEKASGSREDVIAQNFAQFMDSIKQRHEQENNLRDDQRAATNDANQLQLGQSRLNLDATLGGIGPNGQLLPGYGPNQSGSANGTKQPQAQVVDAYTLLQNETASLPADVQGPFLSAINSALRNHSENTNAAQFLQATYEELGDNAGVMNSPLANNIALKFFQRYFGKT
jgi:hypothetical protein